MQRAYRALQLGNLGLALACVLLAVLTLITGRGAASAAFLIAAVWWTVVALFWRRRARGPRTRPAVRLPEAWPEPFEACAEADAPGLEAELRREVRSGHPLWKRPVTAIARSTASDDVLFALRDGDGVALVHLTWSGARERPGWPETTLYPSVDAFLEAAG